MPVTDSDLEADFWAVQELCERDQISCYDQGCISWCANKNMHSSFLGTEAHTAKQVRAMR